MIDFDINGVVLPDATASTSQEFEYEDDNGSGNGNVTVPEGFFDYYKKMLTILVISNVTMAVIFVGIIILVAVITRRVKRDKSKKSDGGEAPSPEQSDITEDEE